MLVVDHDRGVRGSLGRALALQGFQVREAADGLSALDAITADPPDTVALDLGLPGLSGVEVVRHIRAQRRTLPVCTLADRDEAESRLAALAAGADDCLVTPFPADELAARLHAMVRRQATGDQRSLHLGELTIEPAGRVATRRGRDLHLTIRELDLLAALARHSGRALTRAHLLTQVWGYTWEVDGDVIDTLIGGLRCKLEAAGEPRILNDVPGDGFVVTP